MIAEIITVGTEIMIGSILNTNSKYIASKLIELGIESYYHTSVDDNEERLTSVFNIALNRADIIITTGGLGPTQDDLTKEVISKALGRELVIDLDVEAKLVNRFAKMNHKMTDNNRKQAYIPVGSEIITNDNGSAPGIYIKTNKNKIILLPGPPKELIHMFENHVVDLIRDDQIIIIKSINTMGISESALESILKSLDIYESNFEIATFVKDGAVEIKIIARGNKYDDLASKISGKISIIENKVGKFIYGYDNISITEVLFNKLRDNKYMLSICESCTGGAISSKITAIPGASTVFDRGIVTYSNNAKIDELGVNNDTLNMYGAVSEETAYEMAKGLINKTKSDIVLSITGIAGPDGGTEEKPIGLVYICVMDKNNYKITKNNFSGNRSDIQERASLRALSDLNSFLAEFENSTLI